MNTRIEQQVTATEMKYLRRVANKTRRDMERNTNIGEELESKPLTAQIETKQLSWYGHVKRMGKDRIPRKILEVRMEGKKARGRPRTTWFENIERAVQKRGKSIREMSPITADRKKWKDFIMDPTP